MSKEAKDDVTNQQTNQMQQESETDKKKKTAAAEPETMNIAKYLSLYADTYESDMVLFFKQKFKTQVQSAAEWKNIIAAFLEKPVV